MPTGTLKHWKNSYGFLKPDDGDGGDVFVHFSDIKAAGLPEPQIGQRFGFDMIPDPKNAKRSRATNLQLV